VPRKYFRKYLPDRDTVRSSRLAKPFGSWLHHPSLWCLNRRSVSGAVAIGLFCGLIPGPLQMLGKNIPVALIVTLYTNPVTIVPLYVIAFEYGRLLLGLDHTAAGITPFVLDWSDWLGSMHALGAWMLGLGRPLALGLMALALTLAALGYVAVEFTWRAHVWAAWRARKRRRSRP
jgi:uncharacterized protein